MAKPGIFTTVANSYRFLFQNGFYALKIITPLLLWLLIVQVANSWLKFSMGTHQGHIQPFLWPFMIVTSVIFLLVDAAMAIAWHRAYLLGPSTGNAVNPLRMGKTELQFVGKYVIFGLLMVCSLLPPFIILALITALTSHAQGMTATQYVWLPPLLALCAPVLMFVIFAVVLRVALYFPAKATGRFLSFRQSYTATKGLGARLALVNIIGWAPVVIAVIAYRAVFFPSPSGHMFGYEATLAPGIASFTRYFLMHLPDQFFGSLLILFLTVTNLSQFYKFVLENRPVFAEGGRITDG